MGLNNPNCYFKKSSLFIHVHKEKVLFIKPDAFFMFISDLEMPQEYSENISFNKEPFLSAERNIFGGNCIKSNVILNLFQNLYYI